MAVRLKDYISVYSTADATGSFATRASTKANEAAAAGGGVVMLPPDELGHAVASGETITVPSGVIIDLCGQLIVWTDNTTGQGAHLFRILEGGLVRNGRIHCAGSGDGSVFRFDGIAVFTRKERTSVKDVTVTGEQASRSHTALHCVADGTVGDQYVNWVRTEGVTITDLLHGVHLNAKNGGTHLSYVNGNKFLGLNIDDTVHPIKLSGDANSAVNRNTFEGEWQVINETTRLASFDFASDNHIYNTSGFDWRLSSSDTALEFNDGSIDNLVELRASNADPDLFAVGLKVAENEVRITGQVAYPGPGTVRVSSALGVRTWRCRIDGQSDNRETVREALLHAVAHLPATVEFGPGDYGMYGGIDVRAPQGARGLTIRGAGPEVTRFRFTSGVPLTGGQEIMLKFTPPTPPTVGDFDNYLRDFTFQDLGFYDDEPDTHGTDATDESHCISVLYGVNIRIENCNAENIGDEAFNLSWVKGGHITGCQTINSPAFGVNGSPFSIQQGSSDIVISGNRAYGSGTHGVRSTIVDGSAVSIAALTSDPIENITVEDNHFHDFDLAGLFLNPSAGNIRNIIFHDNTVTNVQYGLHRLGGSFALDKLRVAGNMFKDCSVRGFSSGVNGQSEDHSYKDNDFQNCPIVGSMPQAERIKFEGNTAIDCERGVQIANSTDGSFNNNIFKRCGGANIEEIEVFGTGNEAVDNKIIDSQSTNACIEGVQDVHDNRIERGDRTALFTNTQTGVMINNAERVTGNRMINGGARLGDNVQNGVLRGNWVYNRVAGSQSSTRYPFDIKAGNLNTVICDNTVDTRDCESNQLGLRVNAAASGCLIDGNVILAASDSFNDNAGSVLGTNIFV